jgi:hypothetical protein
MEYVSTSNPILGSWYPMAAQVEKIVDGAVGGEKALSLAGRLEPPHLALLLTRRLVGQLGTVIQSLVLAMLDTRHDRFLGRGVALELIGNQHPWDILEPFE